MMMDQILTHCGGVIGIADDVGVHGKDDKEHDKCLHKFMNMDLSSTRISVLSNRPL